MRQTCGMIEWETLPRGTLRLQMDSLTADVWKVGNGARWTADDGQVYLGSGEEPTVDAACEAALRMLGR